MTSGYVFPPQIVAGSNTVNASVSPVGVST
jgi:hypothetical protein